MSTITVGIAAGRKYENYLNWIRQTADLKVIKLSHEDNNLNALSGCDGVILTGGEDVHPGFYNRPEYLEQYALDDIDRARNVFEWKVLELALERRLPVLGICRGLQLANVFFGGSLIPDIPSFGKPDHTKYKEGKDRYHGIRVENNTLLRTITGTEGGEVNSAHHQGVDRVGKGLIVNAVSPDGIVEGMEGQDKVAHPLLLLVQWHPERMLDQQSAFSMNIRKYFLKALKKVTPA